MCIRDRVSNNLKQIDIFYAKYYSHGRKIERIISVFLPALNMAKVWKNFQTFIKVERLRFRGEKYYEETVFDITSITEG